jgi:serine/threonine protein kinase
LTESGQTILREALGERYRVVEKLGSGAFGEVYRAHDTVLGRDVAIKRIRLDVFAEPGQLEEVNKRFLREAQVAAKLRHPNIVTTHDIVSAPGMSFIVMELVEGRTLHSLLQSRGRLSVSETLEVLSQVAAALDDAHGQHVVHRDVKPANIMIEASGQVKVMDFGIAKLDSGGNLTATGHIVGTPNYMSPEQARGESVDGRSDLFSLGCILYECVSGEKAFKGDSITAILLKVLSEEPPPVDFRAIGLPPELGSILDRALAKKASERFSSGAELVGALRAVNEEPLTATNLGVAPRALEPPPVPATVRAAELRKDRPRRTGWIAAAVLAGIAGALWGAGAFRDPAPPARNDPGKLVVEEPPSFLGKLLGRKAILHVTVPPQTKLDLVLATPLTSETAEPGDVFTASLASSVSIESVEALPAGSIVSGHVSQAQPSGKASGRGELTLELDSVEIPDGDRIAIEAEPLSFRARSTKKKDAGLIGGLAGVGAVVGGLIGGKKGAAIGGAAGGSAGTGVVLSTKSEEMVLPEGTSLSARIRTPFRVSREKP